jgi:replicative DNA helicase
VLLSQLNRDNAKAQRRPQLHDLRDSGAIEQDADVVLFIHTEDGWKVVNTPLGEEIPTGELIVAKNRNGPTDNLEILYVKELTLFLTKDTYHER